jgi:hypothetical protein
MRWPLRTYLFRGGTWLALVVGASFASLSLLVFTGSDSNMPSGIALPPGAAEAQATSPEAEGPAEDASSGGLVAATTPSSPVDSVATLAQVTPPVPGAAGDGTPAPGGGGGGPTPGGGQGDGGPGGDGGGPGSLTPPDNPTPREPPAKPPTTPPPPSTPPRDDDDKDDDDGECKPDHDDPDWDDDDPDWDHDDPDWDDDDPDWDDDSDHGNKGGNGNHYGWDHGNNDD